MATTVIENLVTRFSFQFDRKKLLEFDASFKNIIKSVGVFIAGVEAAGAAVFAFTEKIAQSNDALFKLSQRMGIGVETLQEFGYVAELNGGSVESMNSALENLNRIASQAARGIGDGVEVFGMLGISATDASGKIKTADSLMMEIADSVSRLGTQAERLEFTQRLGIGPDLLLALQQGSQAIREQREEVRLLGIAVNEDAGMAAANFNDAMLRTRTILKSVVSVVGTRLMKVITPMITAFVEWFKVNKALVAQNIAGFLETVIKTAQATTNILIRLWRTVDTLAQGFGGWKETIAAVGTALLILNAKALIVPLTIAAAVIALGLLIEELVKFDKGGETVLGDMAKESVNLEAALRTLIHLWKMVGEGWKLIFTEGEEALEGFVMFVKDKFKELSEIFTSLPGVNALLNITAAGGAISPIPLTAQSPVVQEANRLFGTGTTAGATTNNTDARNITINVNGGNVGEVWNVMDRYFGDLLTGANENLSTQTEY